MNVNLFYLTPNPYGGWVTYTYHLIQALELVGIKCSLYKITKKGEKNTRDFGYSLRYRNINIEEALSLKGVNLIVALNKQFKCVADDLLSLSPCGIVVHDPTEIKNLPESFKESQAVVIRKTGLKLFPGATLIRHPYGRFQKELRAHNSRENLAASISRIDFDKHTEIILEANEDNLDDNFIHIYGFENRLYTKFKIKPRFPNWEQSVRAYPREENKASSILTNYKFHVDMSEIKGDGGGTQYTFLESWDAGCVNIINSAWIIEGDDMVPGINCLSVSNSSELTKAIENTPIATLEKIVNNGYAQLSKHSYEAIGNKFKLFLSENVK